MQKPEERSVGNDAATTGCADGGATFETVLAAELTEVSASRTARIEGASESLENAGDYPKDAKSDDPYQRASDMKLAGLAFSGGGIRSATFNLGVLQGLARLGLLKRFDYLSTVSGGGYIGSWFTAWIKREQSFDKVEEGLHRQGESGAAYQEPDAISFLRKYSNYLTPRMGMFTADTWALIATYVRNLALNLLTITAFFLSVFLVPRLAVWYASMLTGPGIGPYRFLFSLATFFLAIGTLFISLNQTCWSVKKERSSDTIDYPWYARQGSILAFVATPIMLSALCGSLWLRHFSQAPHSTHLNLKILQAFFVPLLVSWLAGSLIARIHANAGVSKEPSRARALVSATRETFRMVGVQVRESIRPASRLKIGTFVCCMTLAILVGYGLFIVLSKLFHAWNDDDAWLWYALNFGAPLVVGVYLAIGTILIGLMGRQLPDESREWWSRLGGWLVICTLLWTGLCAIAFFSLPFIASATKLITSGWIVSTITGVFLGKSPVTGGTKPKKWVELAAKIAPSAFIVGLLMFLSFVTSSILIWTNKDLSVALWKMIWLDNVSFAGLVDTNFFIMNSTLDAALAWMFLVSLGTALLLSWRIDVNQFSIHLLYRNRLVRGYLGASNKNRKGQPFTGFDPNDDLLISDLQTKASNPGAYHGPYPIVNTALNLVKGKELAWQTRKAASFIFTPIFSGYALRSGKDPAKATCCYRATSECAQPDGMSLGTAVAISGAAASPNMGYHSSPALAFLMTVFDVRLGWWSGNPRYGCAWQKAGPGLGLWYMLKELFGLTNDESGFVYLSDGGHFENLGLYELVKRRCRFIVACDAGQDGDFKFDDLGNALRKIRVDLGVDITIDVSPILNKKKHCALGKIIYHTHDHKEEYGDLIYIKSSLCNREPADVLNYKALHAEFPHQTTADQWFDEAQFESYRMLGLHSVLEICEHWDRRDVESLVKSIEVYIEKN
jgi:hypothetical protein